MNEQSAIEKRLRELAHKRGEGDATQIAEKAVEMTRIMGVDFLTVIDTIDASLDAEAMQDTVTDFQPEPDLPNRHERRRRNAMYRRRRG